MTHTPSVDELRTQLRDLGYLSSGLERWFTPDPFSPRTSFREMLVVASKGATLVSFFALLPLLAVMLVRNHPLPVSDALFLSALYAMALFVLVFALVALGGIALRFRPSAPIHSPRLLNALSFAGSGTVTLITIFWWSGFDVSPDRAELLLGSVTLLIAFGAGVTVISAAILSFAIHESHSIPIARRSPRTGPMLILAVVLIAGLVFATRSTTPDAMDAPLNVPIRPSTIRIALVGVDGLSAALFNASAQLRSQFAQVLRTPDLAASSSPERWASIATGVPRDLHGVHSVDAVRLLGSEHLIQSISSADFVLRNIAPAFRLATRQPLPPTARDRDYVWEITASRGIHSAAIDWWASDTESSDKGSGGSIDSIPPQPVFAEAVRRGESDKVAVALQIDVVAIERMREIVTSRSPRVVTVYLPAVDIIANRLPADSAERFAALVKATETVSTAVTFLREAGYEVMLAGSPGDDGAGRGIIATTFAIEKREATAFDVAPTLLSLAGFPISDEMPGSPLNVAPGEPRIKTYGSRRRPTSEPRVDDEYYENLRSLGYVR